MTWQLIVAHGCRKGLAIIIHGPRFMIGRNPSCHLRPSSPFISDRHCELVVRDGRLFITRSSATAATQINDSDLDKARELQNGDRLTVGPLSFVISGPTVAARKAPIARPSGEEAIAEMLLSMEDVESPRRAEASSETISDHAVLAKQETAMEQPATKTGTSAKVKAASTTDTSEAASEILRHYRQRPR